MKSNRLDSKSFNEIRIKEHSYQYFEVYTYSIICLNMGIPNSSFSSCLHTSYRRQQLRYIDHNERIWRKYNSVVRLAPLAEKMINHVVPYWNDQFLLAAFPYYNCYNSIWAWKKLLAYITIRQTRKIYRMRKRKIRNLWWTINYQKGILSNLTGLKFN